MDNVNYKDAELYFKEVDKNLLATDERLSRVVSVLHKDGSRLFFKNAFCLRWHKYPLWLCIFTEHHGLHIYHEEDLDSCEEYIIRNRWI